MVRDYRSQHDKWQPAIIHKRLGPLSYQVAVHGGTAVWLRHADQMRQSNFKASQGEEEVDMEEFEGPSGEGLPDQRQGEQKQNGVQPHPETTHVNVQPQQSASPAHAETNTNEGHTPVLAPTVTATHELQPPRIACEPLGVASRTSADIPKSSEVVTTRSGRIVKKPQRY